MTRRVDPVRRRLLAWLLVGLHALMASGLPLPVMSPPTGTAAARKLAAKDRSQPYPCMDSACGCDSAERCFSSCCCHTHADDPDNAICSDYQSLAAEPGAPPDSPADEEPAPKVVILRAMLACGGIVAQWAAACISLPPPETVTCELPWPCVGEVRMGDGEQSGTVGPPARSQRGERRAVQQPVRLHVHHGGWTVSLAPYLELPEPKTEADLANLHNAAFRCPNDPSRDPFLSSYALNVHLELDPRGDDYVGSPASWRKRRLSPRPKRTILVGEAKPKPFADHFMCHLWSKLKAAETAVAFDRHGSDSHYLFVDGHVEPLRLEQTFDPAAKRNLWNPSLAE